MANFTPVSAAIGGALIGLSAVLLMLSTGRIAGISGIFSGLLNLRGEDKGWRIAFIAGLILAPVLAGLPLRQMTRSTTPTTNAGISVTSIQQRRNLKSGRLQADRVQTLMELRSL